MQILRLFDQLTIATLDHFAHKIKQFLIVIYCYDKISKKHSPYISIYMKLLRYSLTDKAFRMKKYFLPDKMNLLQSGGKIVDCKDIRHLMVV
jgi:hypothetical protein